jgi:hypothetical protein
VTVEVGRLHRKGLFTVRAHRSLQTLLLSLAVLYAAVAFRGGIDSPRGEFFPVFNWSLFTYVSPTRGLLELHVKRIGDRTFDTPVNYFDLGTYFASARERTTDLGRTW